MKNRFYLLILFACSFLACKKQEQSTIKFASYNIRMNTSHDKENAWPNREELVKSLVRYHDFDVWGVQEALPDQMQDLREMDEFLSVGEGRDGDGEGEHAAIFFRKDRFEKLDEGDFWLSETPTKPSLGWDATCCNRICSWVKLLDKENDEAFWVINTHFDHEGQEARAESAKLILHFIEKLPEKLPLVLMGDFNCGLDSEPIQQLSSALQNSYTSCVEKPYGPAATYNGFRWDREPVAHIDYIFINNGVEVLSHAILTDSYEKRYPSDHFPVVIEAVLKKMTR